MKRTRRPGRCRRAGISAVWLLLALPVLLIMFFSITTIAGLWMARIELENAAEAAARAAVKVWGDGADTPANRTTAHQAAAALAMSNLIFNSALTVDPNNDDTQVNNNATCPGTILLGQLVGSTFVADQSPAAANERGAYVSLSGTVTSPWLGGMTGPFTVNATAAAVYTSATEGAGKAKAVLLTRVSCQ
jgi:Flp pilus assembly protein TadG